MRDCETDCETDSKRDNKRDYERDSKRDNKRDCERDCGTVMHEVGDGPVADCTREVREGQSPSVVDVFPVERLQDLGTAEPLEADLHVVVVPLQRLGPQNPAEQPEGGWVDVKKKTD